MPFRKSIPMWLGVSLFAASITMMPLVSRRRSANQPGTLAELGARLSQGTPPLHGVWQQVFRAAGAAGSTRP